MKTPFVLFSFELAVISTESMTTNATKTFIGESSLTGAIVQTGLLLHGFCWEKKV